MRAETYVPAPPQQVPYQQPLPMYAPQPQQQYAPQPQQQYAQQPQQQYYQPLPPPYAPMPGVHKKSNTALILGLTFGGIALIILAIIIGIVIGNLFEDNRIDPWGDFENRTRLYYEI